LNLYLDRTAILTAPGGETTGARGWKIVTEPPMPSEEIFSACADAAVMFVSSIAEIWWVVVVEIWNVTIASSPVDIGLMFSPMSMQEVDPVDTVHWIDFPAMVVAGLAEIWTESKSSGG
jgi:hypothetical protein